MRRLALALLLILPTAVAAEKVSPVDVITCPAGQYVRQIMPTGTVTCLAAQTPVGGAPAGSILTTGDSIVGGRCDYSDPIDSPSGYNKLCIDAKNSKVIYSSTKSPPTSLIFDINGTRDLSVLSGGGLHVYGNQTTPYTSTGHYTRIQNNASVADSDLWPPANPQWNLFETRLAVPQGSTAQNISGITNYLVNNNTSAPGNTGGNALNFMGMAKAATNGAAVWGLNTVANQPDSGATGIILAGYEGDFNISSAATKVRGIGLFGLGYAELTSDVRDGIIVGSLSLNNPGLTTWLRGFVCDPAAIVHNGVCLDIQPEKTTGAGLWGPAINFWYTDNASAKHYFSLATAAGQKLAFNSDTGTTNGGVEFYPDVLFRGGAIWPYTVSGTGYRYSSAIDAPTHKLVFSGGTADATVQFNTTVIMGGPLMIGTVPTSCTGLPAGSIYQITGALHVC